VFETTGKTGPTQTFVGSSFTKHAGWLNDNQFTIHNPCSNKFLTHLDAKVHRPPPHDAELRLYDRGVQQC
jgi:hypothetical protein